LLGRAQRDHDDVRLLQLLHGGGLRLAGQLDLVVVGEGGREPLDRGLALLERRVRLGLEDRGDGALLRGREVALERILDRLGLAAGHLEPASGQMLGLAPRQRHRRQDHREPRARHPPAPSGEKAGE
jgi:hypothetical protein